MPDRSDVVSESLPALPPLESLAAWAAFESSRILHAGDEWCAAGIGLVVAYAVLGVLPRGTVGGLDVITVLLLGGAGLYMQRFCRLQSASLSKLTRGLLETSHGPTQR